MKNVTIILGIAISAIALLDYLGLIGRKYCSITCLQNFDGIGFNWFGLLCTAFIFSLLLNLYSPRIHNLWWRFARITLPTTLIISTLINLKLHHNNFGPFNMDNMFDIPALVTLYAIFAIGSFIQIWRGYKSK